MLFNQAVQGLNRCNDMAHKGITQKVESRPVSSEEKSPLEAMTMDSLIRALRE